MLAVVVIGSVIGLFGGIFTLQYFRKARLVQVVSLIEACHAAGKLSRGDYRMLKERYTGPTRLMEWMPNRRGFAVLYEDEAFRTFVATSGRRIRICWIVIVLSVCVLILAATILPDNPS